ncbi:MAG: hypothetical protein HY438_00940 [DPANN group archaeon]|nr:hypothetical protein [DPANN group archaeon]
MKTTAIVTVPPYAPFIKEVAGHPIVSGLRLNTVMPTKEPLEELLRQLNEEACGKPLWIDLKGRQLRTVTYAVPPFTEIKVSHSIKVKTPVTAYFGNGDETATLVAVDGNKLIFQDGPRRVVGPGESINIIDRSLEIAGYFTETDLKYIEAAKKAGLHNYMLSFVESESDIESLVKLDKDAVAVAKIESQKGLNFVGKNYKSGRLMAACGDLYVEVGRPHKILDAVEDIIAKDKNAIMASRIFPSLVDSPVPAFQDILAVGYAIRLGYETFMFGDEICMRRESILGGLNLLEHIANNFERKSK